MRRPRYEVVTGDAGPFARFIAANGREVWRTSETYVDERDALHAIEVIAGRRINNVVGLLRVVHRGRLIEVRRVNEREKS